MRFREFVWLSDAPSLRPCLFNALLIGESNETSAICQRTRLMRVMCNRLTLETFIATQIIPSFGPCSAALSFQIPSLQSEKLATLL